MRHSISGLLVLHKPAGLSSRQALDRLVALFPRAKMGHAGTLDPMATGVLVVCMGLATRLIRYVQEMPKHYSATLQLGLRSETHDLERPVLPAATVGINRRAFEACLAKFRGRIMQMPPQYSAVRVGGRRAYELARAGENVPLQPRPVTIDRLVCAAFDFPNADLGMICSSGTYVRSLVRDIGEELGCGAVMTRLVRTAIGDFRLEDALVLDSLTQQRALDALLPVRAAVQALASVTITADQIEHVRHGRAVRLNQVVPPEPSDADCALVDESGELLGTGMLLSSGQSVQPRVVLIANQ